MKRVTRKEILNAIDCPNLGLLKSTYPLRDPYFVFVYDWPTVDGIKKRPVDTWVNVKQLNHMSLEAWASIGKAFVAKAEAAA